MRIRSGSVELREFEPALTETLYAVRNHASVRRHLRDPRPIAWDSHVRWVREHLLEARTQRLFLVERSGVPAGIALLRNFRGGEAEIGVMIVEAPLHRLTAYVAAHLIGFLAFELLGLERLLSYVPKGHGEALDFNRRCGFEPTGAISETYEVLALSRTASRTHPAHKRFRETRRIAVQA